MSNRPKEMEFSGEVKIKALERASWKCESCGVPKQKARDGYLEIHHVLGIYYALNFYPKLSPIIISSLANAQVLCKDCHQQEDNRMEYNYKRHAHALIQTLAHL